MDELGYVDLLCEDCNRLYTSRHPKMEEIEYPICPSCRDKRLKKPKEKQDEDHD